jgi:holo-[acyl-carrier-protein] synthase
MLPEHKQAAFLAKTIAVKESLAKALGTGIQDFKFWKEVTLYRNSAGAPGVICNEPYTSHVSISDAGDYVFATVILEYI